MLELLISLLFTMAIISLPLQLALIKQKYMVYSWLGMIGIFVFLLHKKAIEQSYSIFQEQLADADLIGNLLVIQIIEAIGGILLSIYLLSLHNGERVKKGFRYFKYIPGLMPFIALFYLESHLFFNIQGMTFHVLGIILGILISLIVFGLIHLFKWILVEYDLRLELKFFLHITQLTISIIISVLLFRLPVHQKIAYVPIQQTGLMIGCGLIVILLGKLYYDYRFLRQIK